MLDTVCATQTPPTSSCVSPPVTSRRVRHLRRGGTRGASDELLRTDRFTRQLFNSAQAFGYYAYLFYLAEDDSFVLEWRLPTPGVAGSGFTGEKAYTNVEECMFSYKDCIKQLADFAGPDALEVLELPKRVTLGE